MTPTKTDDARAPGALIAGRYRLSAPLGGGSQGAVWEAIDQRTDRLCAVKFARGDATLGHEFRALLRVEHRGLPAVYDAGALPDGGSFLVMARVLGQPLHRELAPNAVVRAVAETAEALAALHDLGLVHGDVKPENILLTPEGAVLVDLGLAAPASESRAKAAAGTLAFMAPEQLAGERSPATDLYALGATALWLLTGAHPLVDAAQLAARGPLLQALAAQRAPRPEVLAQVPAKLREHFAALCDPQPARRGPTARAWLARLARDAGDALPAALRARCGSLAPQALLPPPLCGRDAAVHAARAALEAALDGGGLGLVLCGPDGSGRARLAHEALRALHIARSVRGPTVELLDALDAPEPDAGAARPRVLRLLDAAPERLRELGARLARRARFEPGAPPVALLATCREDPGVPGLEALALGPLDEPALRELVAALAGVAPTREAVVAWRRASDGLPGRLVQLLSRAPLELRATARDDDALALARAAPPEHATGALEGPDAADARTLAALLDALGEPAPRALLYAALGVAPTLAGLAALARVGLVFEHQGLVRGVRPPPEPLALARADDARSPAVAAALAALASSSLERLADPPAARARLTLASTRGDDAGALRAALACASAPERPAASAARWLAVACALAPRREDLALAQARAWLRAGVPTAALAALEPLPPSADDAPETAVLRLDALRRAGATDRARALATRLLAAAHPTPRTLARAALARDALERADDDASREAARALLGPPPEAGATDAFARLRWHEAAALVALAQPRLDEPALRAELSAAEDLAAALDDDALRARVASLAGMAALRLGAPARARSCYELAYERALRSGDAHGAATYAANVGAAALECGALADARAWLARGAQQLARLGRVAELARALANEASLYALLGDRAGCLERAERAERAAREARDGPSEALARTLSSEAALAQPAQRAAALEAAALVADRCGAAEIAREARARAALALVEAGRYEEARAALSAQREAPREGNAPPDPPDAPEALARLALALASGAPPLDAALRDAHEAVQRAPSAERELLLARLTIRAHERRGDEAEARRLRAALAARLEALGAGLSEGALALFRDAHRAEPAAGAAPAPALGHSAPRDAQLEQRWRRLAEVTRELHAEPRLRPLLERIMDAIVELTGAARGLLLLQGPDGALRVRTARNLAGGALQGDELAVSRSVAERVARTGEAIVTVDATSDERLDAFASVHAMQLRSILAVPLRLQGQVVGTVYVDDRYRAGAFDEGALEVAREFAEAAAVALHNARTRALLRRSVLRAERLSRELRRRVERQTVELEATRRALAGAGSPRGRYDELLGRGPAMTRLLQLIDKVAPTAMPVLLQGESGTGKELLARALHGNSLRAGKPFVAENCGAIPEPLLESVLFGHVKGAFTGAERSRAGLFEVADGGTLFLDEVGEMSPAMQTRLLRVLQEGEVRPVGGERARRVDVRVLTATHRDLAELVKQGRFREDLYYRLAVMVLDVPPLRQRREDLPELIAHFIAKHAKVNLPVERGALARLLAHPWPGNVRQLENEILRACVLAEGALREEDLSPALRGEGADAAHEAPLSARASAEARAEADGDEGLDLRTAVDALERRLVERALRRFQGNQSRAAKALGLSRFGLQKKLKRLGQEDLPAQTRPRRAS